MRIKDLKNAPEWLKKAETKNEDVEITDDGQVIWKSGVWIFGVWENGLWRFGVWEGGIWLGGTWENGMWKSGKWKGGIWRNGLWISGIWENGLWINGIFSSGILYALRQSGHSIFIVIFDSSGLQQF